MDHGTYFFIKDVLDNLYTEIDSLFIFTWVQNSESKKIGAQFCCAKCMQYNAAASDIQYSLSTSVTAQFSSNFIELSLSTWVYASKLLCRLFYSCSQRIIECTFLFNVIYNYCEGTGVCVFLAAKLPLATIFSCGQASRSDICSGEMSACNFFRRIFQQKDFLQLNFLEPW